MSRDVHHLPKVLPVFPLTGSLLLPGTYLPLNVFEPRYRNMVRDARSAVRAPGGFIGMIQPFVPMPDDWGPPAGGPERPELYDVGCVGRIERCEEQPDGRFLIVLEGMSRFRVLRELDDRNGYRRIEAGYSEFDRDLGDPGREDPAIDASRLVAATCRFAEEHELEIDADLLGALSAVRLVNALSVALPFSPQEKQALLEAEGPGHRQRLLLALMGMAGELVGRGASYVPPTVH